MAAFWARFFFVVLLGSLLVDIKYGGFSMFTFWVGVISIATAAYWVKNTPLRYLCKTCGHHKDEHRGSVEMHGPNIHGVCVVGAKPYGEYIYANCDCLPFVPKWKFWSKRNG